jgi:hypothetical protein
MFVVVKRIYTCAQREAAPMTGSAKQAIVPQSQGVPRMPRNAPLCGVVRG